MSNIFDTLLLLALPASGKSEVRTFLSEIKPEQFHMGPTIQLDDYPYVHLQILVDSVLGTLGHPQVFHYPDSEQQRNGPFQDPLELGGLIHLLNEDYSDIRAQKVERPKHPGQQLLERFDIASARAGAKEKFKLMSSDVLQQIAQGIDEDARKIFEEKARNCETSLEGKTIVIEFARGGPPGDSWPLPPGYGYASSLPHCSTEMLENASILYIWVTPEESRRKNRERARPDGDGSILFHGTPESVMEQEYSRCDMAYLIENQSHMPGTIRIDTYGRSFDIPIARFDNREDLTTFVRNKRPEWKPAEIKAIEKGLKTTCDQLWAVFSKSRASR